MARGAYAVITGASQGLGEAFAEACARRGWNLVLCALAGTGLAEVAGRLAGTHGVEARMLEADLSLPQGRRELLELATAGGAAVDLLVNNVGFSRHGYFDLMPTEVLGRMVQTNIMAAVEITRGLIPVLARSAPARIITVSSLSALRPMALVAVYAASQSFLLDLGLALRLELAPRGVSSTVLCPGPVYTSPEVRARIAAQGLGARLAALQPDQVAEAALRGALRGRRVVVPGAFNKLLRVVTAVIPRGLYMRGAYRRWRKALARSAGSVDAEFFDAR